MYSLKKIKFNVLDTQLSNKVYFLDFLTNVFTILMEESLHSKSWRTHEIPHWILIEYEISFKHLNFRWDPLYFPLKIIIAMYVCLLIGSI